MAQLISVKLSRFDGSPWGFRLQGGKDFGTPLIVQKVNNGSPAAAAGLRAGDAVIRVNSIDMFNLRHKDAQDVIVRAGNTFEVTVHRGANTWRPSVSPVTASIPAPQPQLPASNIPPVTKTSLAAKKQDIHLIGSGHNFSPKPFLNGTSDGTVKSIVNKQYNSPVGIYSEETIAETLSAQAEVLAGGVLGVNFKKNEKNYNAQNSEVFKMVQEADKEPKTPEPAEPLSHSGVVTPTSPTLTGLRSVQAPETRPQSGTPQPNLLPGQNICADCERLIIGVFVRIKEKNLHVECFKCSTCGTSLKNVGYYNINNKLYCDIHAKLVARQNAPAGLIPVTVGPGQKAPASTISAALSNIGSHSPSLSNHGNSSPQPLSSYMQSYSPEQHQQPQQQQQHYYNSYDEINSNGVEPTTHCESKTYTSTLTIRTQSNGHGLDCNRNPTNNYINNTDNKLHKLADSIRDFALEQQQDGYEFDERDYCSQSAYTQTLKVPATNNIGGPKPFLGSTISNQNYSSSPIINTGSSTLPRSQTQSLSGESASYYEDCYDLRHNEVKPQFYHEDCCSYEVLEEIGQPKVSEKPPTPRNKFPTWPPIKPIEDITYPTASPLYIDPNPTIDKQTRQVTRERRATVASVISREYNRRNKFREQQQKQRNENEMEQFSCVGPVFRRVELADSKESRQSRCDRSSSRASSTDSIRRSLTPTRITQPTPRPWTATVTSGTNLFQSSYKSQQEHICGNYCGKEVCKRDKVCQREQSLEREISQTIYKRESPCERHQPILPKHQHQEQHVHSEKESCTTEGNIHQREHKTSQVCRFICESKVEPQKLEYEVQRKPSIDLSKLVPSDVAICPKGIDGEHDLYTETEEEDKGNLHIKKTTTYEKIVELVTPDQEIGLSFGKQEEQSQFVREQFTQRSSTVDREVEDISGRKHLSASSETLTQKIDTQQLIEETRMREDKERKLKAVEEQRQREEEERKRQKECLLIEMRKKDEEKQIQRLKIESQRKAEERRRLDEETAERSSDLTIYGTQRSEIIEEKYQCPNERINNVQLNDRPPSTERIIKIQMEDDQQSKAQITVVKEETNIKKHCELKDYKQQRRKSLREQVEVHQSLRDQLIPERRQPTLQERRLCSRFSQQSEEQHQKSTDNWNSKKHVQFVKVRETEVCSVPQTPVKNSNRKEWQSDMCKSLSTTSDHKYSPLQSDGNMSFHGETRELHHHEVTYKQNNICTKCQPKLPPIPNRSVSPFVAALTTASDRPYSPLGRDVDAEKAICRCQSQTPEMKTTYEGYSAPSQILYRGKPKELPKKSEGPRPLPTPPLDFRFRNRSASPCYSRSQTPSGRVSSCGLKKPETIPQYQKCLVCEEQSLVQGHDYLSSSRTPTPGCCKSPTSDPLETPTYFIRAPRIRDDPPPCKRSNQRDITTPNKTETVQYHYEENTPKIHKNKNTICSKTVSWLGEGIHKHAHIQEHNDTVTEECDGSHHITKMERKLKEYDESEQPSISPVENNNCYISQNSDNQPTLQCPKIQNSILDKIQKTGIRVFAPMGAPEVRRIRHDIPPLLPKLPCPMTGVTVLPIKAHGDTTCKSGVVVVPCDGIGMSGVCITPTPDRLDVSVSPCLAQAGGICKKPSCYCGSTSGNCTTTLGNDKTTHSVDAGICTGIAGVRSVQYPKPILKCLSAEKAKLPFPQIPHPEEQSNQYSNQGCPRNATNASSTSTSFSSNSESRDCGFQPIHKPQPRTNLCNQITTLTLCKRESQAVVTPTPQVPRVQLYKPQSQSAQLPSCISNTTKIKCQNIYNQNRFQRETQTICETQSRTQSQIQTQTSCLANKIQNSVDPPNLSSHPDLGSGASGFGGNKGGTFAGSSAPNRGKGILNQAGSGLRVPLCAACDSHVRGPFISALGQIWCPEHFVCVNLQCRRGLQDIGFVEEKGQLYCEYCFERFIAPSCNKCNNKIKGDCLNAIGKHFHPECFNCAHCGKHFGNSPFFLEEGLPYCERDWNDLFTTKCFACGFPVEAGDRWVEALNNNYHSQCFNCTMCKQNLEGQSFYAKGGRPFCKNHAR